MRRVLRASNDARAGGYLVDKAARCRVRVEQVSCSHNQRQRFPPLTPLQNRRLLPRLFFRSFLSPVCSRPRAQARLVPPPPSLSLPVLLPLASSGHAAAGYGRWPSAYARPRCSLPPSSPRHVTPLLPLQLYAGALYIHSNLTDRLGNAAPSPRLFLLQVLPMG